MFDHKKYYIENKEYHKQYYIDNKEKIIRYGINYYLNHREKIKEYYKQYYINNKEKYCKYDPEYYQDHKEKIKKYYKKYYIKHKKKGSKQGRQWREKNPERTIENRKRWHSNNPEKFKMIKQRKDVKRQSRERKIINTLTFKEWLDILEAYNSKCAYCDVEFNENILPTKDHIIPISKGGDNTKENVVPACRSCNSKKGVKIIRPFQPALSIK